MNANKIMMTFSDSGATLALSKNGRVHFELSHLPKGTIFIPALHQLRESRQSIPVEALFVSVLDRTSDVSVYFLP